MKHTPSGVDVPTDIQRITSAAILLMKRRADGECQSIGSILYGNWGIDRDIKLKTIE